jgi:hypothetical protein
MMHPLVDYSRGANNDIKWQGDGGKRNESPPPKTSSPAKHIAGQKLQSGNKAERTLAASVERHIEPRRPPGKK